ncbi:MAG: hypothetical protein AAFR87_28235 [Bacteroidota bacterium]
MFLLLQYSAFDFRLLQSPHVLVPPIRSWPLVQPNQEFVNNFGMIRESYKSVLSPHLLPEDNMYVDCRNSLKFSDLNQEDDPLRISVKMRRMVFDGRGGVKFFVGMVLHMPNEIPFQELGDALQFALQKKVRISSPSQEEKEVSLANLSASFKNLYLYSSTIGNGEEPQTFMVRQQAPLLLLDLSLREFEHFGLKEKYEQHIFPPELQLYYCRNQIAQKIFPSFLSLNLDKHALNRLNKYYLSQLNTEIENFRSLQYFTKQGISFSERAQFELDKTYSRLFGQLQPEQWQRVSAMYHKLFPQQIASLKNDYQLVADFVVKQRDIQIKKQLKEILISGDFDKSFNLAETHKSLFDESGQRDLAILEARYRRIEKEYLEGVVENEARWIEKNRISSSLLNLFRNI